jgi:tellurite resistance protein
MPAAPKTAAPKIAAPRVTNRPPRFPPPQFPPHKPKLFASTPPAIFPSILGLMGLVMALRRALPLLGLPGDPVELLVGAVLALWVFAVLAIKVKALRRLSVLRDDMRPLPGRAGLAAATMSGMLAGALVAPYSGLLALILLFGSLVAHAVMLGFLLASWRGQPAEVRAVNPTLHLSLVGFIVAAPPLAQMGWTGTAAALFWLTAAVALAIWVASAPDLLRRTPPAPLRPLLAIHLSPAALLSSTAALLGWWDLATLAAAFGLLILLSLIASARWITAAGFTPMWGAFTFPLAAFANALMLQGGPAADLGLLVTLAALIVNPVIAWKVLKLWPGNRLAQKTNAAEA